MNATQLLVWGMVIHWVFDWLGQNHWMATYKSNLKHPAAYVHSGLHTLGLLLIFHPLVALAIGVIHLLIDTRVPLVWWRRVFRQTNDPVNPASLHVAMWGDQVLHIAVIATAALLVTGGRI